MSKIKTYTPEQVEELRVVAKSKRGTWTEQLTPLAKKFGRTLGGVFAKTNEMAIKMGNAPIVGINKGKIRAADPAPKKKYYIKKADRLLAAEQEAARKRKLATERKKNWRLNNKSKKSYYTRKHHESPLKSKMLNINANEARFKVNGIQFERELDGLYLVVRL